MANGEHNGGEKPFDVKDLSEGEQLVFIKARSAGENPYDVVLAMRASQESSGGVASQPRKEIPATVVAKDTSGTTVSPFDGLTTDEMTVAAEVRSFGNKKYFDRMPEILQIIRDLKEEGIEVKNSTVIAHLEGDTTEKSPEQVQEQMIQEMTQLKNEIAALDQVVEQTGVIVPESIRAKFREPGVHMPTRLIFESKQLSEKIGKYAEHELSGKLGNFGMLDAAHAMYEAGEPEKAKKFYDSFRTTWDYYVCVMDMLLVRLTNEREVSPEFKTRTSLRNVIHGLEKYSVGLGVTGHVESSFAIEGDVEEAKNFEIMGNEGVLLDIVINIARNPGEKTEDIGATRLDTKVYVSIVEQDGKRQLVFEFEDDGVGMNEEGLKRIFKKEPTPDAVASQGLGLAYVDSLVKSMGGNIVIETVHRMSGKSYTLDTRQEGDEKITELSNDDKTLEQGTNIKVIFDELES